MPRTPAFRHRYRTGSGYQNRTPNLKRLTYAVAAGDTPDAIRSPLSHRDRTYLEDAEPLNAVQDRCDIRNTAAIKRLERQIDELKQHQRQIDDLRRETMLQIDDLKRKSTLQKRQINELKKQHQRQIKGLKRESTLLKRDLVLLNSRQNIICREIVVCVYDALGHNPNNPRQTTFQYIRNNPGILEEAFQVSPNDVPKVLDALDPRPNRSWIKMGNGEAHGFSVAEAGHLIDDEAIKILFNALTQNVEDKSTTIQDASFATHNVLVGRIPALNVISNLPNPNNGGTASLAEVERIVQKYFDRLLPRVLQAQASRHIPPPPGVDSETYR
jgi:hypothetical protein